MSAYTVKTKVRKEPHAIQAAIESVRLTVNHLPDSTIEITYLEDGAEIIRNRIKIAVLSEVPEPERFAVVVLQAGVETVRSDQADLPRTVDDVCGLVNEMLLNNQSGTVMVREIANRTESDYVNVIVDSISD